MISSSTSSFLVGSLLSWICYLANVWLIAGIKDTPLPPTFLLLNMVNGPVRGRCSRVFVPVCVRGSVCLPVSHTGIGASILRYIALHWWIFMPSASTSVSMWMHVMSAPSFRMYERVIDLARTHTHTHMYRYVGIFFFLKKHLFLASGLKNTPKVFWNNFVRIQLHMAREVKCIPKKKVVLQNVTPGFPRALSVPQSDFRATDGASHRLPLVFLKRRGALRIWSSEIAIWGRSAVHVSVTYVAISLPPFTD